MRHSGKSLKNIINNNGPRIEPCGTPDTRHFREPKCTKKNLLSSGFVESKNWKKNCVKVEIEIDNLIMNRTFRRKGILNFFGVQLNCRFHLSERMCFIAHNKYTNTVL